MPDTSTEGDAGITDAQERIRNAFDGRFERRSRRTRAIVTSVQSRLCRPGDWRRRDH